MGNKRKVFWWSGAVFLVLLFGFTAYKLIALSKAGVILIITVAFVLVGAATFCVKEAADKIIVKTLKGIPVTSKDALTRWLEKRFAAMTFFLSAAVASAFCLVVLGVISVMLVIGERRKDFIDIILILFGVIIFSLGGYVVMFSVKELAFVIKKKSEIISKLLDQLHALIPFAR